MNFDNLFSHDLPTGAMALIGIVLLFVVFKSGKLVLKLVLLLMVAGLFSAAYWFYTQR
jgi:hypothetical protein